MRELACIILEFADKGKSVDDSLTETIELRLTKEQREQINKELNKK